jgi:large subunit ribosomal protein L28
MLVLQSRLFRGDFFVRKQYGNLLTHGKIYPKNGGVNMSRVCNICGKGQASGNNVSHSNRKTRRTFKVNVQKISYVEDGKETNGYVCARCIRTLKKAD